MRIYLACTVRGDRSAVTAARSINVRLQELGHEVLTSHLLADDVDTAEAFINEHEIFRRDIEWLKSCDAIVAEASGSSYGVGFEVGFILGRADRTDQRVVLCYDGAGKDQISRMISGNDHPRCTTVAYRNVEELLAFLDRLLGPAT
jgi:hypothetical protein